MRSWTGLIHVLPLPTERGFFSWSSIDSGDRVVSDIRLVEEMDIGEAEIERRKAWLGFGPDDVERLRNLKPIAAQPGGHLRLLQIR
jgi:hypothetical protein